MKWDPIITLSWITAGFQTMAAIGHGDIKVWMATAIVIMQTWVITVCRLQIISMRRRTDA